MKVLSLFCRGATFELSGTTPYYSKNEYEIFLDGKILSKENRNVFSVFGLESGEHIIEANGEKLTFTVSGKTELNVRAFGAVGDGTHDDTAAFSAAIGCAPKGAAVYVPAGTYFKAAVFKKRFDLVSR